MRGPPYEQAETTFECFHSRPLGRLSQLFCACAASAAPVHVLPLSGEFFSIFRVPPSHPAGFFVPTGLLGCLFHLVWSGDLCAGILNAGQPDPLAFLGGQGPAARPGKTALVAVLPGRTALVAVLPTTAGRLAPCPPLTYLFCSPLLCRTLRTG